MEKIKIRSLYNTITILAVASIVAVLVNVLFLYLIRNSMATIGLLQKQAQQLQRDQAIISSSQQIFESYTNELELISSVFPDEESILVFIQDLEGEIQSVSTQYSMRFTSLTPLTEQNRLYLLMNISMKADMTNLDRFLEILENIPYMIHVTNISGRTTGGAEQPMDITLGMKVYVQNPFTTE